MRADLLREISEKTNVTNAIILTHNIDFVFLQTLVLSKLRRCGQPALTVFADAGCAAESYATQAPVIEGLGVRFRVVPVEMEQGFRFHPKAVLLSGPTEATLYIGSGNLTFGGWRENAECWVRFQVSEHGTGPFTAFLAYLRLILTRLALAELVTTEVEEAFDPATRRWAAELSPAGLLLGRPSAGTGLLDQILEQLGGSPVDRVTICSPYFDDQGEAISEIIGRFAGSQVAVLVQPGKTGLKDAAWKRNEASATLTPVSFSREDGTSSTQAFIHAKYYAFERGNRTTVFLGSANCSRAALLIPGRPGNAELLAVQEMSTDEFRGRFLEEFDQIDVLPELPIETAETTFSPSLPLRLLAASYENGFLRVAYAPPGWTITGCTIDGAQMGFEALGDGSIRAQCARAPREVALEGTDGKDFARTSPRWVDQEWQLRSTAKSRSLGDSIRKNVRTESWGLGAWTEVLEAFCSHLAYIPSQAGGRLQGVQVNRHPTQGPGAYTAEDVFAADYSLPHLSAVAQRFSNPIHDGVHSLQTLLLRWFELATTEEPVRSDENEEPEGVDEEAVDRPEQLPIHRLQSDPPKAPTKQESRRAVRVIEQICKAMTASAFLSDRPVEMLCADLRLTSVLFRVALSAGWIDEQTFFGSTNRIWSSLFYSDGTDTGWILRRYQSSGSLADFAAAFRSPELVAGLASWALAVSPSGQSPEHARFFLGSALSIARLSWLWDGLDQDELSRAFAELLLQSGISGESQLDAFTDHWVRLVRRGHALRRFEAAVLGMGVGEAAKRVHQSSVRAGELLWQGKLGFCVVSAAAERTPNSNVSVLRVFGSKDKSVLKGNLTLPISALLDPSVLPVTPSFDVAPRSILADFLGQLEKQILSGA